MKKIKLLIFIVLCLITIPSVYAYNATAKITGTNTVKVGNTTTLYVKVDSSDPIRGVDLTYSSSGNITITNVSPTNGLTTQYSSGGNMALYTTGSLSSGSSILAITVRGNQVGTGTVSISKLEATLNTSEGLKTAASSATSFTVTVNPQKTQAEIDAENEKKKQAKDI